MYGFRSGGMGGLGDACAQIATYYQPYFTQGPGPGNDANYQSYVGTASNYGCTPEPESYFTNYTAQAPSNTQYANVNDAATAILAQNPSETPGTLQGQLSSWGSLATSGVLNAFVAAIQAQLPGTNPNTIGAAVAANWNTANVTMLVSMLNGSGVQVAVPVTSAPVQSAPVASTPVVSAPATVISTPDIPVTPVSIAPSGSSASDAVNVAQQVTASNPDATVQQVAQAIATSVPAATPNQITQAATNAVVAVVQAQVPSAPTSQIVDAVTTNPATPPSQIATGVALTQTGSSTASGTVTAQPVGQLIPLSSTTTPPSSVSSSPVPAAPITSSTPVSSLSSSLPTLNTSTGNVTPAGGSSTPVSTAAGSSQVASGSTTPSSWCFPGDTSAPFSAAIPVCSNTLLGVAGLFAFLLILGR